MTTQGITEYPACPERTEENMIQISTWKEAVSGDPEAMYRMGWYHENGIGAPRSHTKCVRWYELAAENENDEGIEALGEVFWSTGDLSYPDSLELLKKYCEKGRDICMIILGQMYYNGTGFRQSYERSAE